MVRSAEVEALGVVRAQFGEEFKCLLVFDALGDRRQPELFGDCDDDADQALVVGSTSRMFACGAMA